MLMPIDDFDGYYVSAEGEVFCDLGKGNRRNGKHIVYYKLKPRLTKNGYARICARQTSTNKRKDLYIHRLVATYFIPNPNNKKYVNHINCIRDDNRYSNLEWCTQKENTNHTLKMNHITRDSKGRYKSNFSYF